MFKRGYPLRALLYVVLLSLILPLGSARAGDRIAPVDVHDFEVLPSGRIFAVGSDSSIQKSDDDAETWTIQQRKSSQGDLEGSGETSSPTFLSVAFGDDLTGVIAGEGGSVLRTVDGGETWDPVARFYLRGEAGGRFMGEAELSSITFREVVFVSQRHAWLIGDDAVFESTDGGGSWVLSASSTGAALYGMDFFGESFGMAVGEAGTVLVTEDGGETWAKKLTEDSWEYRDVYAEEGGRAWICGESGTIMFTENRGETWTRLNTGTKEEIHSLAVSPDEEMLALFERGVLLSSGGVDWRRIELPSNVFRAKRGRQKGSRRILSAFFGKEGGPVLALEGGRLVFFDGTSAISGPARVLDSDSPARRRHLDSIEYGLRWDTSFGYLHPLAGLSSRFGPGGGMDVSVARNRNDRVETGGALFMGGLSTDFAPVFTETDKNGEQFEKEFRAEGLVVSADFLMRWILYLDDPWVIAVGGRLGPIYHRYIFPNDDGDRDAKRRRLGAMFAQEITFTWSFTARGGMPKGTFARMGLVLTIKLIESYTWNVDGVQSDLGERDESRLGLELWPCATLGFTFFFDKRGSLVYRED